MTRPIHFYILAILIGLVQGGVQSSSRALFTRLVPAGKEGEFFGFFNVVGRFATVLGPVLIGVTGLLTGSARVGIASLSLLFISGAWLLSRLKTDS